MPQKAPSGNMSVVGVFLAEILGYLSLLPFNPAAEDLSDSTLRRIAPTLILDATEEMTVLNLTL
jgi:hypothetical protein